MKKITIYIVCLVVASLFCFSCKRQHIFTDRFLTNSAKVWVDFDWSSSTLESSDISNVSLYAFTSDEESPYLKISGNIDSAYINLPQGSYSVLVFNDTVDDIEGMSFEKNNSFTEFLAQVITSQSTDYYYDLANSESIVRALDRLAVWRTTEFEVSEDMIACGYCNDELDSLTDVRLAAEPTLVTKECVITLRFENLNNAQTVEAAIKGLASGVYLASGEPIAQGDLSPIYIAELTQRTYDSAPNNNVDGVIVGQITTFGKSLEPAQSYEVVINIILANGEKETFVRDVSDQVTASNGDVIYIELTDDDNLITLPEYMGTGFGVSGWENNSSIELL